jgi:hypothetical protein
MGFSKLERREKSDVSTGRTIYIFDAKEKPLRAFSPPEKRRKRA